MLCVGFRASFYGVFWGFFLQALGVCLSSPNEFGSGKSACRLLRGYVLRTEPEMATPEYLPTVPENTTVL